MKSFKLFLYDNTKGLGVMADVLFGIKPRKIGFEFKKEMLLDRYGNRISLVFYFWKWYRGFYYLDIK